MWCTLPQQLTEAAVVRERARLIKELHEGTAAALSLGSSAELSALRDRRAHNYGCSFTKMPDARYYSSSIMPPLRG